MSFLEGAEAIRTLTDLPPPGLFWGDGYWSHCGRTGLLRAAIQIVELSSRETFSEGNFTRVKSSSAPIGSSRQAESQVHHSHGETLSTSLRATASKGFLNYCSLSSLLKAIGHNGLLLRPSGRTLSKTTVSPPRHLPPPPCPLQDRHHLSSTPLCRSSRQRATRYYNSTCGRTLWPPYRSPRF